MTQGQARHQTYTLAHSCCGWRADMKQLFKSQFTRTCEMSHMVFSMNSKLHDIRLVSQSISCDYIICYTHTWFAYEQVSHSSEKPTAQI